MRHQIAVIALAFAIVSVAAQGSVRLWVVQAPDKLVEYDVATFAPRATVTIPAYAARHPEFLRVNSTGHVMYEAPHGFEFGDSPEASGKIWFWNGTQGREMPSQDREPFLSADGRSLIWFADTSSKVTDRDGVEQSMRTSARVWRTDLNGANEQILVSIPPAPSCQCTTGSCSESCPVWTMWARDGVVGSAFILTLFTEGQIQSSYERSVRYRLEGGRWQPDTLTEPLEGILTSDPAGATLVEVVPDAGCCGWMNESSDQTAIIRGGRRAVLFDEFEKFGNTDYDISFYSARAVLAPGRALIAHSIHGDVPQDEIRLSDSGKPNPAALTRITSTIGDLPITEILDTGATPKVLATIRHADAIGWLNDRELLVVENNVLAVYDAAGKRIRTSTVHVDHAAAYLR